MINGEMEELKKTLITQATVLGLNYMYYEGIDLTESSGDKKIREIMEACISSDMDPWKINITEFAKIVGKLVNMEYVSLPEAGYIIMRSWAVVHMQSEDLLMNFSKNNEEISELEGEDGIEDASSTSLEKVEWEKILPPIHHHETRKVMLVELMEVMRETERSRFTKRETISPQTVKTVENILSALNMDEPEKELEAVNQSILELESLEFMMEEVWGLQKEERMKFFIYCMFLQRKGIISMEQEVSYESIRIRKNGTGE